MIRRIARTALGGLVLAVAAYLLVVLGWVVAG